jgi:hypothetical protein
MHVIQYGATFPITAEFSLSNPSPGETLTPSGYTGYIAIAPTAVDLDDTSADWVEGIVKRGKDDVSLTVTAHIGPRGAVNPPRGRYYVWARLVPVPSSTEVDAPLERFSQILTID